MITSTANPRIKEIRQLRDRKFRRQSGLFYMEGLRIIGEAVQQKYPIELIIACPDLLDNGFGIQLLNTCRDQGVEILEVSKPVFEWLALKDGPQGLAAVGSQMWKNLDGIQPAANDVWVALYQVADPGNLGTILRTLDAVGGSGVILLENCTDPFDPAAVRASMGALFVHHLVSAGYNEFAGWLKGNQIQVLGTSDAAATDYHSSDYDTPLILMMGSEREGLPEKYAQLCHRILRIPMTGVSDSLNLAVATGIILYEVYNHQRDKPAVQSKERRQ